MSKLYAIIITTLSMTLLTSKAFSETRPEYTLELNCRNCPNQCKRALENPDSKEIERCKPGLVIEYNDDTQEKEDNETPQGDENAHCNSVTQKSSKRRKLATETTIGRTLTSEELRVSLDW